MKRIVVSLALTLSLGLSACSGTESSTSAAGDSPLEIFATTGYLADTIANIAPEAEVITMVGPGGDPHTYQPSTKDIQQLRNADLVYWNGLHLEAQMINQLESLGDKQLAVGEEVPESMLLPWENNLFDPHIWNSPEAWKVVVNAIVKHLSQHDPDNQQEYQANAEKFIAELDATAAEAKTKLDAITAPRILVSGHDAFNYFGQTFNLEVRATDFISSEAVLSATELSELADYIADNKVPVIFKDNQANPQAITALKEAVQARGWDVVISDEELFADSLGADPGVNTYLSVLEHNSSAVAEALTD